MIFNAQQLETMGRAAAADRAARAVKGTPAQLVPTDEQLGLDGSSSDVAPASERLKLFEPAPAQIPGQTSLELEGGA